MPRAKKAETPVAPVAAEPASPPVVEVVEEERAPVAPARTSRTKNEDLHPGQQPRRQMKVGRVVGEKMDKTVIVAVEFTREHRLYKKAMKRTSKFAAHDEKNECHVGDMVRIEETRPLSKTKHWIVREVVQRRVVI